MGLPVAGVFFTEQLIEGMQDPRYLCGRPAPCRIDLTFQLLLELEVAHMAVQESVIAKASYQQNTKAQQSNTTAERATAARFTMVASP